MNSDCDPTAGPTWSRWHENGTLAEEVYYVEGNFHRGPSAGPAWQAWHDNRDLAEDGYCLDGLLHRNPAASPAWREWNRDGELIEEVYGERPPLIAPPRSRPESSDPRSGRPSPPVYYLAGRLRCDPTEGSAWCERNENGELTMSHYCVKG